MKDQKQFQRKAAKQKKKHLEIQTIRQSTCFTCIQVVTKGLIFASLSWTWVGCTSSYKKHLVLHFKGNHSNLGKNYSEHRIGEGTLELR